MPFPRVLVQQKKLEQMADLNKRLKLCIKWFQRVEESVLLEQEKLQTVLECTEKKCNDAGSLVIFYVKVVVG